MIKKGSLVIPVGDLIDPKLVRVRRVVNVTRDGKRVLTTLTLGGHKWVDVNQFRLATKEEIANSVFEPS